MMVNDHAEECNDDNDHEMMGGDERNDAAAVAATTDDADAADFADVDHDDDGWLVIMIKR